jgi:hypothetical protein
MRHPRRKADQRDEYGYYHCVARVVDRQFLFGETEKEHLVKLMKRYADFGVPWGQCL